LAGFDRVNPGLKVYADGLSLPWRSRLAAKNDEENFLPFATIAEVRLLPPRQRPSVLVVRRGEETPREFVIEKQWIPDLGEFLSSIKGKVPVMDVAGES
jgi:hypothetical protein